MKVKRSFVVTVNIPDGVTPQEMGDYIRAAMRDYCHCTDFEHSPVFDMVDSDFTVKPLPEPKHTSRVN